MLLVWEGAIRYTLAVSDTGLSTPDRDERIAALEAALATANAELAARDLLIETLRVQIAKLRRMQFGASSERLLQQLAQLELALEELEVEAAVAEERKPVEVRADRTAPNRGPPDHLPREEIVHEPSCGTCACPDCGGELRLLGRDTDEQLDVVPVCWRVIRHIRPKYSCRSCERIVQAPVPPKPIAGGKATFATLAHVVVAKFDHNQPSTVRRR